MLGYSTVLNPFLGQTKEQSKEPEGRATLGKWQDIKKHLLTETGKGKSCSLQSEVVSASLRPHELQPARPLCLWDFPGKNAGVGYHFLLQRIFPTQDQIHISCVPCIGRQILYH